jgi:hypothetical protein
LEKAPFFVLKENTPALLQLNLINSGDKMLVLDMKLPSRISFLGDDGPENRRLEGMTSHVLTFSIDTTGIPAGQYSLGGISIVGQNSNGHPAVGSPLVIPVSIEILSDKSVKIEAQPRLQHFFHLPIVLKSTSPTSVNYFAPPVDILVNGQPQVPQTWTLRSLFGAGWYDFEEIDDTHWRWAKSPADIFIYSDSPKVVQISSAAVSLAPDPATGETGQGLLTITTDDQNSSVQLIAKNQAFTVNAKLQQGWNVISLALSAGNFIPAEIDPQNGDGRELSFAIKEINVVGEEVGKDDECCYP